MPKLENFTNLAELQRLLEAQSSGKSRDINPEEMTAALQERVKGQDHVIEGVVRLLKQQWAKEKRKRPIANLLFVGPTGTGKTELAKAMAEYLYRDEKAAVIIDCADLGSPESKNRLIGAPSGYIGSDKGGELTRKMLNNPKRVVVFDEVEKAHTLVLDLFLSTMGDGRLTDQSSGEVADFTQAVIILTSNLAEKAIVKLQEELTDPRRIAQCCEDGAGGHRQVPSGNRRTHRQGLRIQAASGDCDRGDRGAEDDGVGEGVRAGTGVCGSAPDFPGDGGRQQAGQVRRSRAGPADRRDVGRPLDRRQEGGRQARSAGY